MLAIIPARGGSKGIPGKNIKPLNGKPLIQYTVDAAREVFSDQDILVTTDDPEIKRVVEELGLEVPFLRPTELADDKSGMQEVLLHALDYMEKKGRTYDAIVLLQPTSPFRKPVHIKEAIKLYNDELDMVTSVKETKSNPYYVLKEENEEGFLVSSKTGSFIRRQDCPKVWELNGAVYVINVKSLKLSSMGKFKKVKKYVMDDIPSHDIDEPGDWRLAELYIASNELSNGNRK